MTTFKGFVRSANATLNRMERAHQRRVRESAKIEKLRLKEEMLTSAAQAVDKYNELIAILISTHKEIVEPVDWKEILEEPAPTVPTFSDQYEHEALEKLTTYKPSFFDKLFGMVNGKKNKLEQSLAAARIKDSSIFEKAKLQYGKYREEWEKMQRIGTGVLNNEEIAYRDAMELFNPFAEVIAFGTQLNFTFHTDHVLVNLLVQAEDVLPRQTLSLTSTGKLSKKDMPVSKSHELYQDHVCSCLLRVGKEVLALLPVEFVIVNVIGDLLNSSTGRIEQQAILSAAIFPETLVKVDFDRIDPSDSMKNFKHFMDFSKTSGFKPVEELDGSIFSKNPGNGVEFVISESRSESTLATGNTILVSSFDQKIISIYQQKGALHAVKFYKDETGSDLVNSKKYVDSLLATNGKR